MIWKILQIAIIIRNLKVWTNIAFKNRFRWQACFLICKEVDRYFIDQSLCYLAIFLEDETSKYFSLIRFSLPVSPAIVFVVASIVDVIDIVDLIWIEIIGFTSKCPGIFCIVVTVHREVFSCLFWHPDGQLSCQIIAEDFSFEREATFVRKRISWYSLPVHRKLLAFIACIPLEINAYGRW